MSSFNTSDVIQGFVEDSLEHLGDIERLLLDIESAGDAADEDLVNSVFRAAHSIKGGAAMLGYENIKELAHKLENVLHMVRNKELTPGREVVGVLLAGFDRLRELVDNLEDSAGMSVDTQVERLLRLTENRLPEAEKSLAGRSTQVGPLARGLAVDALSLAQARKGGNYIYLLEFDLIHDIHGKDKMPLEVLKSLESSGRILECKLDIQAVGTLEEEFGNSIPLFMLYATILDPEYIGALVKLPTERIRVLEDSELEPAAQIDEGSSCFGDVGLERHEGRARVVCPETLGLTALGSLRRALLAALPGCREVVLDLSAVAKADVFALQLLVSAGKSARDAGVELRLQGLSGIWDDLAREAGFAAVPGV